MASRSDTTVRFDEILVNIGPQPDETTMSSQSADQPRVRSYNAYVYTNVAGFGTPLAEPAAPASCGGLPLVGVESLRIRWPRYEEYLSLFQDEEKSPSVMRERLLETMSGGLENIFDNQPARPTRVWWNCQSPELEELPWELLTLRTSRSVPMLLVRGVPGELAPLIPLSETMKLGVVGAQAAPHELATVGTPNLKRERYDGPLRAAFSRAVADGCELIHVFANGRVSLGFDTVLELGGETVTPGQLHSLLVGSRTAVVAFSLTREAAEARAKSTYSAFSHLSGGTSNTSFVAPVGPATVERLARFWTDFYAKLDESLSVEDALTAAHRARPAVPIAVFLRQRLGREFTRRARFESTKEPQQIDLEVRTTGSILDTLQKIQSQHGTKLFDDKQFADVRSKLTALDSGLDSWRKPDGGGE